MQVPRLEVSGRAGEGLHVDAPLLRVQPEGRQRAVLQAISGCRVNKTQPPWPPHKSQYGQLAGPRRTDMPPQTPCSHGSVPIPTRSPAARAAAANPLPPEPGDASLQSPRGHRCTTATPENHLPTAHDWWLRGQAECVRAPGRASRPCR